MEGIKMIEVKGITKVYGNKTAIEDISFTMEKGHIYGLLGPNGAGKSTTMNIMTGYITSDEGTVSVNDSDIYYNAKTVKEQIGYLPEIPPLYPEMTVREYLCFVAELKGRNKKEIKDIVEDIMEKTGVSEEADRLIKKLSKGYKQRVGFAQALLNSPEVLILDEPTAGLDPIQIKEMNDLLISIKGEHTILISSHILSEIQALCDHVFMIADGRLVFDGDIDAEGTDLEALFLERVMKSAEEISTEENKEKEAVEAEVMEEVDETTEEAEDGSDI